MRIVVTSFKNMYFKIEIIIMQRGTSCSINLGQNFINQSNMAPKRNCYTSNSYDFLSLSYAQDKIVKKQLFFCTHWSSKRVFLVKINIENHHDCYTSSNKR